MNEMEGALVSFCITATRCRCLVNHFSLSAPYSCISAIPQRILAFFDAPFGSRM